jgi:hypothetical protein
MHPGRRDRHGVLHDDFAQGAGADGGGLVAATAGRGGTVFVAGSSLLLFGEVLAPPSSDYVC